MINSQTNVQIDSTGNVKKTNDFGISFFNLLILQGKNGIYKINFSTEGPSSKLSSEFSLINPIITVIIVQDIPQTIQVYKKKILIIYNFSI